jgi:hypothetical protein
VTIPLPAGQTPYITSTMLTDGSWPTGVSFASIPPGRLATDAQRQAAAASLAAEATSEADSYCNQPLRCTLTTEFFHGPGDYRVEIQTGSGLCRVILQRLPILGINSVMVSPNTFPRQWVTVPDGYYAPEYPALGLYDSIAPSAGGQGGQAILIAQGYVNWCLGRHGFAIQVQYTHGWPHCGLTAPAEAGAEEITVDDCTGWAVTTAAGTGAAGVIYDSGGQEALKVTEASVTAGPGTLTLATALSYAHDAGVMASSFPQNIIWGTALFAASAALTRGATATTVQEAPGRGSGSGGGPASQSGLKGQAQKLLAAYRRTI